MMGGYLPHTLGLLLIQNSLGICTKSGSTPDAIMTNVTICHKYSDVLRGNTIPLNRNKPEELKSEICLDTVFVCSLQDNLFELALCTNAHILQAMPTGLYEAFPHLKTWQDITG